MARNLQLAMQLLARDGASKVLRQLYQDTIRQTRNAQKSSDDQAKSQQRNTSSAIRQSRSLQDEYKRASSARSTLGVRSEREIQREIQQTMAAYNRLARTGMMSANEQSRAFSAMKARVSQLRTEMTGVGDGMTRMQRLGAAGSTLSAVAGGVVAAGATLVRPVSNQMSYQQRLAMMANTAYADQGLDGRRAGMKSMDSLVRRSVREGGGTKESAADTLDAMLASGAVDMNSAQTLLPMLQRYSTATGAAPTDLAQIAIRLKQTFGIADNDVEKALNMAISAGQGGSFELADMAKWLPQQLAAASNNGMKGLDDFAVLLGLNQSAAITAGSSDEAGNNVVNLLGKISSQDAANAAARIRLNGSKKGIDLPGSLAKAQGQGINSLDAFVGIIDKIVANNAKYRELEEKLKKAKPGEKNQIIESQAKILEGSAVGKMIADRQALMALIGYRTNKKYAKEIQSAANEQRNIASGQSAGDLNFALMSEQNKFKVGQLSNEHDFHEMDSVSSLSNALGYVSDKLVKYADEYPGLTSAMSDAAIGIKAVAAAAAAFGAIKFFSGRGGKGGGSNPLDILTGGTAPGGAVPVYVTNADDLGGEKKDFLKDVLGNATDLGGSIGKYSAYANLAKTIVDEAGERLEKNKDAAAKAGVSVGEYMVNQAQNKERKPLFETGPEDIWNTVKSWWSAPTSIGSTSIENTGVPSYLLPGPQSYGFMSYLDKGKTQQQPVTITTKVMLNDREIAQAVNEYNGEQSVRGSTGGPQ